MIKKLSKTFANKKQLSFKQTIISTIVMSFFITLICLLLQPTSAIEKLTILFGKNLLVFILNFLPVFLVVAMLSMVLNSLFKGGVISSIVFFITSLGNRYKIIYRDEPLTFNDFSVLKEGLDAFWNMDYHISIILVFFLILFCILLIILSMKYKSYKFTLTNRFIYVASICIIFLIFNSTIYTSTNLYESLDDKGGTYHDSQLFNAKGFIYSVLYANNISTFAPPANYSTTQVEKILKDYTYSPEKNENSFKPNFIFILSEAFMDPSVFPNLKIDENYPILDNYYKILKESIVSGDTVVLSFAGGTVHTEFQVLTGVNISTLPFGSNNPFQVVNSDINAVPRLLKSLGYDTTAMHPGYPWFYNRQNGYKWLGIDNQMFRDYYTPNDTLENHDGAYISEKATYDYLIEEIQNNIDNDSSPSFYNLATIQSHGPYNDKYTQEQLDTIHFSTTNELTNEAKNILSNYLYSLKNIDAQINVLTNYLQTLDEPFIIVYYGDHLPYLGEDYLVYKELGLDLSIQDNIDTQIAAHSTPYFIWGNSSALKGIDKQYVKAISDIKKISINFLPTLTFNISRLTNLSPYFNFTNTLFNNFEVTYNENYYKNNEKIELDDKQKELISNWKILEYYYLKDEQTMPHGDAFSEADS